jgi:hypothetical protein
MDRAQCPDCGYRVGLGIATEPGICPQCGVALMLTSEFRALTPEQLRAEAERRAGRASSTIRQIPGQPD